MNGPLDHHLMLRLVGRCSCECHTRAGELCWCGNSRHLPAGPPTYQLHHNDQVRHLGRCASPHHTRTGPVTCDTASDRQLAAALDRQADQDRDRRIMRGQIRNGSDIRRAIQMGVIPGGPRR